MFVINNQRKIMTFKIYNVNNFINSLKIPKTLKIFKIKIRLFANLMPFQFIVLLENVK